MNETLTAQLEALFGKDTDEHHHKTYLIEDKNIDPKSPNFGKRGASYYLAADDQWYIKYAGDDDFTRVKWHQLESNVTNGGYGLAVYRGINPNLQGKEGKLIRADKKWIFVVGDEKYMLVNPESVHLINQ